MVSALRDLSRLRAPGMGLFGSGGLLFSDAVFGRDSVAAAETLLRLNPEITHDVILTLARFQGTVDTPPGPHSNEEEPGKIHHEHRSLYVGSRRISASSEALLHELASKWGGDVGNLTYYGASDTTPLYARLVTHWCATFGNAILAETVTRHDGSLVTIRESLIAAVDWITRKLEGSELGLIEFQRRNPDGIPFQAWKDSGTSYIHRDGTLANWDAPIAPIEVQGYAFDALLGAEEVLGGAEWRERAEALRERVLTQLWMPSDGYFAMGLDRDADGRPRSIDSIASNGALVLDTRLFDDLEGADDYIAALVRRICSADFVTEAGIRCRSRAERDLVGFQDYHGAWAVWPKETFEVARGLRRQRLHRLARQLVDRLLNAVNIAGANVEFLYVNPEGRVMYDFAERDPRGSGAQEIAGTNQPESPQAWTVTAALALKRWNATDWSSAGGGWRDALDKGVLQQMDRVEAFRTASQLHAAYANRGDFQLNLELGRERDRRARLSRRGS
jgi:glycogen debranching enzyme